MALTYDVGIGMLSSALGSVCGLGLAAVVYRWYVLRRLGAVLEESFRWYMELVLTVEYHLSELSKARSQGVANDVRKFLLRLSADVESALIANDQLKSSLDMPMRPIRVETELARFSGTGARLFSELSRALALATVEVSAEIRGTRKVDRYLDYLNGGSSPVGAGRSGQHVDRPQQRLRVLLDNHIRSTKELAVATGIKPRQGIDKLFDPADMWIKWKPWNPEADADRSAMIDA